MTGLTDQNSRLERRVTSLMDMVDALNKRTQEMVVKPVKPVKQEKSKVPVRVPIKAPVKIPVKIPARRKKNA